MLNERQLNALPERICENLNKMNTDFLKVIGEVIKEIGELRPSDVHKLQKLHEYGSTGLAEELARITAKNVKEIYEIFDLVAQDNYAYAEPFYKASGINYVPYSENEELKVYTRLIAKQTAEEYINFTQTTAFAVFDKTGKSIAPLFAAEKDKMKTSLSDTYIKLVDYAAGQVQMGAESYQTAMREVIKAMADSGIRTVDYATGYSRRLDSAVRQNILWGVKQYNQQCAELIGEDFGADGYEIPYHSNPRPTHAEMGGKMYAKGDAVKIKGVFYPSIKTVEPLLNDYGCLHYKIPVILGVSQPAYSEKELARLKEKDNRTFEFEGKKYTGYEAKQTQRQIETAIRKQKDLSIIAGAAGDTDLQLQAQEKLNLLANKYAKFSKAADLPTRVERLRVEGFKSVKIPQKPLTNAENGGIINLYNKELKVICNNDSISEDIISKITAATKKVLKYFATIADYTEPIMFKTVKGGLAENFFNVTTGKNQIFLDKVFSDEEKLLSILKNDYVSGISYYTENIESLVAHELGHNAHIALALKRAGVAYGKPLNTIEYHLFSEQYESIKRDIYINAFTNESYEDIRNNCIVQLGKMVDCDPCELIAQSFGNYYYGKEKSEIAKRIVNYFRKELK